MTPIFMTQERIDERNEKKYLEQFYQKSYAEILKDKENFKNRPNRDIILGRSLRI
jgi:hypothetical protein